MPWTTPPKYTELWSHTSEELLSLLGHCWAKPAGAAPKGVIAPILRNGYDNMGRLDPTCFWQTAHSNLALGYNPKLNATTTTTYSGASISGRVGLTLNTALNLSCLAFSDRQPLAQYHLSDSKTYLHILRHWQSRLTDLDNSLIAIEAQSLIQKSLIHIYW